MWRMLSQDSVSLELFREEVYRDYAKHGFNGLSSFELMKKMRQEEIFEDLLNYIEVLYYKEDDIYNKMVLVNQCVDIDLKRHQLIATDILHAMPVTIVPDCT